MQELMTDDAPEPTPASLPTGPAAPQNIAPPAPYPGAPMIGRLLISLATYNERDNLPQVVRAVHEVVPDAHILVTDDNSPDGTGQVADELAAADGRIHVLHRPGKLGLGTAYLAAIHHAIEHGYDYLLTMDADLSHSPRYLPALLAGMDRADVMIGSRYVPGGGTVNWPLKRRFMSRGLNVTVRLMLRIRAKDTSGGFRCYRVAMLKQAPLDRLRAHGYAFLEELLFRCVQAGARAGEVPIVFENRRAGASKLNGHEMARSLYHLLRLGVRYNLGLEK
jgi:dolichol-phosphate mannosyltransferase